MFLIFHLIPLHYRIPGPFRCQFAFYEANFVHRFSGDEGILVIPDHLKEPLFVINVFFLLYRLIDINALAVFHKADGFHIIEDLLSHLVKQEIFPDADPYHPGFVGTAENAGPAELYVKRVVAGGDITEKA